MGMEDLGIDVKIATSPHTRTLANVAGSYTYFADGDVLLAKITPCFQNGKLGIARNLKNGVGFGSSEFIVLRPESTLNAEYLYYFLSRDDFRRDGVLRMGGSVGQQRVPLEYVQGQRISLPPLPEQRRIVAILDEAFAAIATAKANTEKNLANARALFESHLQAVFTQRGDGWVEKQLGDVAEFKNGLNFNQGSRGQSVHIVGVADFQSNYVVPIHDLESITIDGKLDSGYEIREGDLLTVRSNGSKSLVGRCMVVPPIKGVLSYSGFVIRIRCDQGVVFPTFLLHFMKSSHTRDRLTRDGGGTNISNINQAKLAALALALPPVEVQRQVVWKLDEFIEETQRLESLATQRVAALDALKKSFLHQAFTGQLSASKSEPGVLFAELGLMSNIELHAGVLAIGYRAHERQARTATFGHVKAEKLAHMAEAWAGVDLSRNATKQAAGPADFARFKEVEAWAEQSDFFQFCREGIGYKLVKRTNFDRLVQRATDALGDKLTKLNRVIDIFVPMDTQQAEVFTTVWTAWNNLLLAAQQPTNEDIVKAAREEWHTDKLKIERNKFFDAIGLIRKHKLVPVGAGARVEGKGGNTSAGAQLI